MTRKQKLNIVHGKTELHTILSQMELSDTPHESQSEIDSSFQPISHIIPQNLLSNSEEESKDHFIEESKEELEEESEEQVLLSSAQRIQINQEDKEKRYSRIETLHSMGYSSKQIAEYAQVNISLRTVKRLKANIRENGSITREPGSGRPQKLLEDHKSFILKLITDSPYHTWNRIAVKLWNKHGVKVDRTTIFRFLVDNGYKWKGPQIVFRNNEQDQKTRLEFWVKNKNRNWKNVLKTDEASFYLCSPGKHRWVSSDDTYERT